MNEARLANYGGWEMSSSRRRPRPRRAPCRQTARSSPPPRPAPSPGAGECPRYLGTGHPCSECRKDVRCRRCRFFGHVAQFCTNSRYSPPPPSCAPAAKRLHVSSMHSSGSSAPSVAGPLLAASYGLPHPLPDATCPELDPLPARLLRHCGFHPRGCHHVWPPSAPPGGGHLLHVAHFSP